MIVNHERPCLSQGAANPHHVLCASSACRTRMQPVLLPPRALGTVVVLVLVPEAVGSEGQKTTTRVSSNAGAPPLITLPILFIFLLPLPCVMVPCCESVCDRSTLTDPVFFFPDTGCPPARRHRGAAKVPISRLAPRTPARPVLENAPPFLPVSRSRSGARAPSDVPRLQRYLHPDRVSTQTHDPVSGRRVVLFLCCILLKPSLSVPVELQSFQIRTHLEFPALVVTGSSAPSHTLRAGSSGYLASFLVMRSSTLIIVVGAFVSV